MIEINLLPQSMRRKKRGLSLRKELLLPGAVLAGIIMIILVVTLLQRMTLSSLDRKMEILESERLQYSKELEEIRRLQSLSGNLEKRVRTVAALDAGRKLWVEILEDLDLRLPDYVWLSLVEETEVKHRGAGGGVEVAVPKTIIRGYAFTLRGLATLIRLLKASTLLKEVELSYFKLEEKEAARPVYSFEVKCSLPPAAGGLPSPGG